jgi:hypothetical protein
MKRLLGKLILVILGGLFIFLIAGILVRMVRAEEAAEQIRRLPDLAISDINDNIFRTDQIKAGPLLITFFHPECDHCRYEIASLKNSGLLDSSLTVILVSYAAKSEIRSFMLQEGIVDTANLHVLHDPDFSISDLFGAAILPSNYIYNDSLSLVRVYKGSTRPEAIRKYLNGNE